MMRALSAFLLSLVLALTSHSAAMAKSAPTAVVQMVICTGLSTTTVYVDADGQPTQAPHLCPDCLIHMSSGLGPMSDPVGVLLAGAPRRVLPHRVEVFCSRPAKTCPARGPPPAI